MIIFTSSFFLIKIIQTLFFHNKIEKLYYICNQNSEMQKSQIFEQGQIINYFGHIPNQPRSSLNFEPQVSTDTKACNQVSKKQNLRTEGDNTISNNQLKSLEPIKRSSSKKKIVVIQHNQIPKDVQIVPDIHDEIKQIEIDLMIQRKIQVRKNSKKGGDRPPSLKQIKKLPSSDTERTENKLEESSTSMIKKVKFEEILCDDNDVEQLENTNKKSDFNITKINVYYQKLKQEKQKIKKQSFLHFLCGLLRFKRRPLNSIEKKLLNLNEKKISGQQSEQKMLKFILSKLICEQSSLENENWKKLGFLTDKPLQQLKQTGVLFLLQWVNFISCQQEISLKFANFCIEISCSAFSFHQQLTYRFCQEMKKSKINAETWKQYQQIYNSIAIMCIEELNNKSKTNISNFHQEVLNVINNWVGNSSKALQNFRKRKQNKV